MSMKKRKTSFAPFIVKHQNVFELALMDKRNLVHSAIVLGVFWESIGGKISSAMDYKVGTADGQSEGLQVLGVGVPMANIPTRYIKLRSVIKLFPD